MGFQPLILLPVSPMSPPDFPSLSYPFFIYKYTHIHTHTGTNTETNTFLGLLCCLGEYVL